MNGIELRKSVDDVAETFMYVESNSCLCVNASANRHIRGQRPYLAKHQEYVETRGDPDWSFQMKSMQYKLKKQGRQMSAGSRILLYY